MDLREWVECIAPALAIPPALIEKAFGEGVAFPGSATLPCGRRWWYVFDGVPGPVVLRFLASADMTIDGVLFGAKEAAEGPPPTLTVVHPIWGETHVVPEVDGFERGVRGYEYQPRLGEELEVLKGQTVEIWADAGEGSLLLPRGIISGSYHDGSPRLW